jgi:hypothetical protein
MGRIPKLEKIKLIETKTQSIDGSQNSSDSGYFNNSIGENNDKKSPGLTSNTEEFDTDISDEDSDSDNDDFSHLDEIEEVRKSIDNQLILSNDQPRNSFDLTSYFTHLSDRNENFDYFFKYQPIFSEPATLVPQTSFTSLFMDSENINFVFLISMIRDKVYHLYVNFTKCLEKNLEIYKMLTDKNIKIFSGSDASKEEAWSCYLTNIQHHIKSYIKFSKELPGLNYLTIRDFNAILNDNLPILFGLKITKLYTDKEGYFMMGDIQLTRKWLTKFFGKTMCECIFEFHRQIKNLKLTDQELALLFPFILTSLGINSFFFFKTLLLKK